MLHMLQWLYRYVARVCSKCFIYCFRRKLQVCLSRCCICFTHMLPIFYLDVAYACNDFQVFIRCFCKCFRRIPQVFQLFRTYVASVSSRCCKSRSGVADVAMRVKSRGDASGTGTWSGGMGLRGRVKHRREQGRAGVGMECRRARETKCRRGHPSGRPGTGTTLSTIPCHIFP
jgi:hypothetical protein